MPRKKSQNKTHPQALTKTFFLQEMRKFHKSFDNKIDIVHDQLNDKIDTLDRKIDTVHDQLDRKIDTVHDQLDRKIDTVHDQLDDKINKLDHKIDTVHDQLDHKINTVYDQLDQKIDAQAETITSGVIQRITPYMDHRFEVMEERLEERLCHRIDQKMDSKFADYMENIIAITDTLQKEQKIAGYQINDNRDRLDQYEKRITHLEAV